MPRKSKSWGETIVGEALKDLRKHWGYGWGSLSTELREALLAKKVLGTINRQIIRGDETDAELAERFRELRELAQAAGRTDLSEE